MSDDPLKWELDLMRRYALKPQNDEDPIVRLCAQLLHDAREAARPEMEHIMREAFSLPGPQR